mgnify:FL=1
MSYPHRPGGNAMPHPVTHVQTGQWTARRTTYTPKQTVPVRVFEAMALLPDGDFAEIRQRAPAHPIFESAFCALARGTIMATKEGPVAVEDLLPGMKIETRDAGYQPLLWIGTMTLASQTPLAHMPARLFRVPVDSFGPSRPMPDLMLAPHARLLHRSPKLRSALHYDSALTPITAFEDGQTVIRIAPVSPVRVYHLAFRDHHILRANGLEIESFHPGPDLINRIGGDSLRLFTSFFPHIQAASDFGPMVAPHLSVEEYEAVVAA